jgi:hypothetical protein
MVVKAGLHEKFSQRRFITSSVEATYSIIICEGWDDCCCGCCDGPAVLEVAPFKVE